MSSNDLTTQFFSVLALSLVTLTTGTIAVYLYPAKPDGMRKRLSSRTLSNGKIRETYTKEHTLGISMEHLSRSNAKKETQNGKFRVPALSPVHDRKTDLMHMGHTKGGKLIIVMVGLPGRGKSYMARKIARYLNWINYDTRVFNIGNYRRQLLGTNHSADFFDPDNSTGYKLRLEMAQAAMDDMLRFLNSGGEVAIYDGTNSTVDRRKWILERTSQENDFHVLFVESVCEDESIIEHNIMETKLRSPDYKQADAEEAVRDFRRRIAMYRKYYQTLGPDDDELSYVQVINAGDRLIMNRIYGFLPMKIVSFVSNLHIVPRPVLLSRHGENIFNIEDKLGGVDSELSHRGLQFSRSLSNLIAKHESFPPGQLCVWTSTSKCARDTAHVISGQQYVQWRALREIEFGQFANLTQAEFARHFPRDHEARRKDKLRFRYREGESYLDVIARLEPVIYELERQRNPVVIIAHQGVLQCLLGYFLDLKPEKIPYSSIPLHTAIELQHTAYGVTETRHRLAPSPYNNPDNR